MQLDLRAGLQFNEARLENISIDISKPSDGSCLSIQASSASLARLENIIQLTAKDCHSLERRPVWLRPAGPSWRKIVILSRKDHSGAE